MGFICVTLNVIVACAVHAYVTDIHDLSIVKYLPNEKQWTKRMKFVYDQRIVHGRGGIWHVFEHSSKSWTNETTYDLIEAQKIQLVLAFDKNITRPFDWHMVTCETVLVCNECIVV